VNLKGRIQELQEFRMGPGRENRKQNSGVRIGKMPRHGRGDGNQATLLNYFQAESICSDSATLELLHS
jgi:hypothetical protein